MAGKDLKVVVTAEGRDEGDAETTEDGDPFNLSVKEHVRKLSQTDDTKGDTKATARKTPKGALDYNVLVTAKLEVLSDASDRLKKELIRKPVDEDDLNFAWAYYTLQHKSFEDAAKKLMEQFVKEREVDEAIYLEKNMGCYSMDRIRLEHLYKKAIAPFASSPTPSSSTPAAVDSSMRMLLPKRELPQFSGDVREWLSFMASFGEINKDRNLSEIDKFHYLIQSTREGSSARKLLQSFPFSAGNYAKALQSLKERFGRNNVLVKVYVRDLLQLVIEASSGKVVDFGDLVTTITSQIRNLETLGVTQDKCAQVLYPVVESCLPPDVLQAWQRSAVFKEELEELIKFLQAEVNSYTERSLAQFQLNGNSSGGGNKPSNKKKHNGGGGGGGDVATSSSLINSNNGGGRSNSGGGGGRGKKGKGNRPPCVFCEKAHSPVACEAALGMNLSEKREILRGKKCCFCCLRPAQHFAQECRAEVSCGVCHNKHHAVMCPTLRGGGDKGSSAAADQPEKSSSQVPVVDNKSTTSMTNGVESREVPLQTLLVAVHGNNGRSKTVRALFDPGSQTSYVLSSLAEELQFNKVGEEEVIHQLFGGATTKPQKHAIVKVFVSDKHGQNNCNFDCSTTDQIAGSIVSPPPGPWIEDYKREGITFDDVSSSGSSPVALLIGNDVAARLYTGRIRHLDYGPSAMETCWGWVLCGKLPSRRKEVPKTMLVTNLLQFQGNQLSALWDLESIGIRDPVETKKKEELAMATQQHFERTVVRLSDGRYQVCLPWIDGAKEKLPSNFFVASRRLKNLTKGLQEKGHLAKYHDLFQLWEKDGMIEEVPPAQLSDKGHYLPHHAVVKATSATTPIRPVFDGSSKAAGKLALNDCLDKGPNTLELIFPIHLRFRLKKIGMLADVKKAFQQISVAPDDRDFLRFLWWDDLSCKKEKIFRHCRVVFGVTSSPYLLGATMRHHLEKATGKDAAVAKQLLLSTYVDNAILSVNSVEEAKEFQTTTTSLLLPAQFDLRGWEYGPREENVWLPVLGLLWNVKDDSLALDVSKVSTKIYVEPTLRHVLSLVHSIFDPMGYASPFTVVGKLLLRRCHDAKCGMDSTLAPDLSEDVMKWAAQIPLLSRFRIPRHVRFGEEGAQYTLHVLCDASSSATAAAVFLRREMGSKTKVFLLASKSRVAPKKKATIPRLELIACVIATRLLRNVVEAIGCPELPMTLWSDSSTALAWIRGVGPWAVFVNNCVEKVRALTSVASWRHIPGKHNIADLPSRGCSAKKLLDSRWWEGPEWLYLPPHQWPTSEEIPDEELVDNERRKTVTVGIVTCSDHPMVRFLRLSQYPRILKAVAVWLQLKRKLKEKINRQQNGNVDFQNENKSEDNGVDITAQDLQEAEIYLLLFVQQELHQNPQTLKKLRPFVDERGIMRTRTRLTGQEGEDFICPILLPERNEFVFRMIRWEHEANCHVGTTTLLGILRQRFWVVNGRRTVRGVLTKCWICRRFTSRRSTAAEAPLPKSRTSLGSPFQVTGLDAAGPLILRGGEKVWIILFTCATYRAVHLELVDTLSAEGFIRALRKFVARRGRPETIYSDNACGFVAANKALQKVNWKAVQEYAAVSRIQWRFNPPVAPWWGGWWERLIGLAKQLLRRVLGKKVVHRGELELLLVEVEECLNNRPLTYSSENVEDPLPLTPNHFVRSAGALHLPEVDLHDARSTRAAYKKLQHLREALRSRFRTEYLGFLRGEQCQKSTVELKPGDVVLVEHDNSKRQDWLLGVILEAIPGSGGAKRLFRLKTRNGEILRPVQRLFLMEQQEPEPAPEN